MTHTADNDKKKTPATARNKDRLGRLDAAESDSDHGGPGPETEARGKAKTTRKRRAKTSTAGKGSRRGKQASCDDQDEPTAPEPANTEPANTEPTSQSPEPTPEHAPSSTEPETPADPPSWQSSQVETNDIDLDAVDVSDSSIVVPKNVLRNHDRPPRRKRSQQPQSSPSREKPTSKRSVAGQSGRGTSAPQDSSSNTQDAEEVTIPGTIAVLALRNAIVFPGTVMPLAVGRPSSRRLITALAEGTLPDNEHDSDHRSPAERPIGVIAQKDPNVDQPGFDDLYDVGTVVTVLKRMKMPDGQNSLVVHGLIRFRVKEWLGTEPYLHAVIEVLTSETKPSKKLKAMTTNIINMAQQMIQLSPNIPEEVNVILSNIDDPGALADFLAANMNMSVQEKQEILETIDVEQRLQTLSVSLANQLELLSLSDKIHQKVSKSIDKSQREYFLREQLEAIQKELGQHDQKSSEINELREKLEEAQLPQAIHDEAMRELDRLDKIPTMSPEFSVQRSYLEWLSELPWSKGTTDKLNIARARRILNTDHYDLVKVKKRILEFLAVRKLNPTGRSPILCFVGPPGVGKTSLGKSIARSMGREFVRISLGGIRDEADIRGHRRTYIGALPGRILQELRKCASHNPVFMLDELDKVGQDFRGDPASAMLEVLDPEQNNSFTDHYIDQPFDLSKVMFIATANYMAPVPPALRDRMEVIELPGYTPHEKLFIAKKYLVPRQLGENGLNASMLTIKDEALERVIANYTREAGVRELERRIAALCRGVASEIAESKRKTATISPRTLSQWLGPRRYESELAMRTSVPGVATGLAFTPTGGEILFIESTLARGKGSLILTGQLGEVMKESAQAALSVLKAMAEKKRTKGIIAELVQSLKDHEHLEKHDIHIHVPAGAVPKDGPSAGLAMITSMVSLLTDQPIRAEVAMTGEITLRGLVLPIGGVKEKVLAAKQAGITTVLLPERNRKDMVEVPKEVKKGLTVRYIRTVEQALGHAMSD